VVAAATVVVTAATAAGTSKLGPRVHEHGLTPPQRPALQGTR